MRHGVFADRRALMEAGAAAFAAPARGAIAVNAAAEVPFLVSGGDKAADAAAELEER